jgi:glyoxylase I family protein
MPQPEGAELEAVRARRAQLKEKYLRPKAERPASTVGGVHHLALVARDVEETIAFYQDLLGFPLVELVENRDYRGSSHFFFDIGNRNLLGFFDYLGPDRGIENSIYIRDPNGVGIEFYVQELGVFEGEELL